MSRRVLLVSGSLRATSTNTAVLRTAMAVAPAGSQCVLYSGLGLLPHFNPDDDTSALDPAVEDLRDRIHTADAVVFSTPEYAGALPGSFKNLLDWTIGDDHPAAIHEKPVAWINVSTRGALAAHQSLRLVLGYAHAAIVEDACVEIPLPSSMVDEQGVVADPRVRRQIASVLAAVSRRR
jgi:NAD(P)H-dependent FMN reductase